MDTPDPLDAFLPPVRAWFRETLGEPTPAQREGWPSIRSGRHTLILAPTGSGKTLAAFLGCLDLLWRQQSLSRGVHVLYISPLKALNNDIYRNLQVPLEGVVAKARAMGQPLPTIDVAVRTGDTPTAERQRLVRRPPHVLITTPESLHILLTSRARETLRYVTHCIVDEIHAVCPNKRGVFLALLLERLQALNPDGFVRIGLSATQRPLDEVARYLGGSELTADGRLEPRPVAVIDAGIRKELDLRIVNPVEQFGAIPEGTVWPSIYRLLREEILAHRSTIVFANNRRTVERITAHLNEGEEIARAHHGSVALEVRQQTEQALKEGRLKAVVATASLELGIDMGAVDLVCQVESPGSVARGLQRVGRAGHVVGQKSKGRLIPKLASDLLELAALTQEMAAGRVEEIHVPRNCLDVLAQQVVAAASVDGWDVPALYRLVRQAYPYRDLSPQAFDSVLEMVSGRYRWHGADRDRPPLAALQPRVSWDRVHNRLLELPGGRQLALVNGGTIPDTGQYAAFASPGVRIGELDEEFIYERRVGDTFLLGTTPWRLERIEADRVFVVPAEGAPAMVPFWRGEKPGRSYELGMAMGRLVRELAERGDAPDTLEWLERQYFLDRTAARNLRSYVSRQQARTGKAPTDRTLVVEAYRDPLGDWQVVLLSTLGSRLHFTLRLALEARLRERLGYAPQCLHHDDGILIRFSDVDEPVVNIFEGLGPENIEALVLEELADSALFALRFRQNAARALLLPRTRPGKRAPLWLQRLRGKDLLQVARRQPDFPIVAETLRECLHDHLDVPRLEQLLGDIRAGRVEVVTQRTEVPSPFAAALQFAFTAAFLYEHDQTQGEPSRPPALAEGLLEQIVAPERQQHLLDPRAVRQVERRLRGVGQPPRSATEAAEWLRQLGDVADSELEGPARGFMQELQADGRAERFTLPGGREPERWILTEERPVYEAAFGPGADPALARDAADAILLRFLQTHALVGLNDVLDRYPFEQAWAKGRLESWSRSGRLTAVPAEAQEAAPRWALPDNLQKVQRTSLALLRREVVTRTPQQFSDFVVRWQYAHPEYRKDDLEGVALVLARLEGCLCPAELWEQTVLPARVSRYQPRALDVCVAGGEWIWSCQGSTEAGPGQLAFWRREELGSLAPPAEEGPAARDPVTDQVLECLRRRGASFVADIAAETGAAPSAVRTALWRLVRQGLVTNDHFDVVRKGEESRPAGDGAAVGRRMGLSSLRRRAVQRPEGRWSLIPWGAPDVETQALYLAGLLLERYGVAARELAALDPRLPPWRVLYEILSRLELSGEVRRGYFVEGLSGAQFALPDAAQRLQDLDLPSTATAPVILLHSQDPANLYGAGAPFDIPLLDGGTRPFLRRAGNWIVLRAGRPVLLVEQQGKRLTALASASPQDVADAVGCLPSILQVDQGLAGRHKLTVEEWNNRPVTASDAAPLLEAAGFVRDYQGMTLYAAHR